MKVPDQDNPTMDGKLKFSDRLKALLKTESRQDVDPYIFSEPEPFATASGKNVKTLQSNNSHRTTIRNNRSRGKCIKRRSKIEGAESVRDICVDPAEPRDLEVDVETGDESRSFDLRFPGVLRNNHKDRHVEPQDQNLRHQHHHHGSASQQSPQPHLQSQQPSDADDLRRLETSRPSRDHTLLYYPRAGDEISDSESSGDELTIYQRHWFAAETDVAFNRTSRLSQLRSQLRRRLVQLHKGGRESEIRLRDRTRSLIDAASKKSTIGLDIVDDNTWDKSTTTGGPLLVGGTCGSEGCRQTSLPCTRHCSRHIMLNSDQLLFEHCTAKFSDNTQCCVPVFDVAHELPLCPEHARKRDNYHRKSQESKPKKSRKKPSSPVVTRPKNKSRPKKRKRLPVTKMDTKIVGGIRDDDDYDDRVGTINENHTKTLNNLNAPQSTSNPSGLNLGLGLGSLAPLGLGPGLKVELGDHEVFASLDPAEHDFGNVLNNLPADAFNDLFIESRNGEYEPSREEEEELERALEAVDKDVQNLERMGQTHGLLEPALLAQLMSDIAS